MVYLLFLLNTLIGASQSVILKSYRRRIDDETLKNSIYYIITFIVALSYFGVISGFNLKLNFITALFSFAYALVAYFSTFFNMKAIENTHLVTISLFGNAGGLLWDTVWGISFFGELLTIKRVVALVIVFLSLLIPYLGESKKEINNKGIIYCIILFVISGCSSLIIKFYSIVDSVLAESVFCFYTNVFMIPFVILMIKKHTTLSNAVKGIIAADKKAILLVAITVIMSNTGTLLSMYIISKIDLIVYSVLGKALSLITVSVLARIAFKEKITLQKVVSILLMIIAVILTVV